MQFFSRRQRLAHERFDELQSICTDLLSLFANDHTAKSVEGGLQAKFNFYRAALRLFDEHRINVSLEPTCLALLARLIMDLSGDMRQLLSHKSVINYQAGRNLRGMLNHYDYCFLRGYPEIGDKEVMNKARLIKSKKLLAVHQQIKDYLSVPFRYSVKYHSAQLANFECFFAATEELTLASSTGASAEHLQVFESLKDTALNQVRSLGVDDRLEELITQLRSCLTTANEALLVVQEIGVGSGNFHTVWINPSLLDDSDHSSDDESIYHFMGCPN